MSLSRVRDAQFFAGFAEQVPGFAVVLVLVAILLQPVDGMEHQSDFAFWLQNDYGGDQIPDSDRNYISGEEIDFVERIVVLLVVVRVELAEVSGAGANRGALDLHAEKICPVLDTDIVGRAVAPRLGYAEAVQGGLRHELEFNPFATLFECVKVLPAFVLDLAAFDFDFRHPLTRPLQPKKRREP